eukprot:CAMPEP_0175612688 /NCGR_PEP_ID=MMETSP0096-20121207/63952_1 /TAXON_ID=311494 /ORGANISM="Alexandrium monilatum, Strain CCMP3105" /LENGTH=151 /DNA_ID=CAMNT_0016917741 /DNA_START=80 /DNA_END=533 /DNA_ORIENTATION=+
MQDLNAAEVVCARYVPERRREADGALAEVAQDGQPATQKFVVFKPGPYELRPPALVHLPVRARVEVAEDHREIVLHLRPLKRWPQGAVPWPPAEGLGHDHAEVPIALGSFASAGWQVHIHEAGRCIADSQPSAHAPLVCNEAAKACLDPVF